MHLLRVLHDINVLVEVWLLLGLGARRHLMAYIILLTIEQNESVHQHSYVRFGRREYT